ncbi:hypothetical protein ACT3CE_06230 [Marinifilum sp. RC60d5]|uniref:hypothetical protein n=1 Tax=Marinifilum sp. RC60d5 TaxID=3458414 RepID=UPI00403650E9
MKTLRYFLKLQLALLLFSLGIQWGACQIYSPNEIRTIFKETSQVSSKDNGLLWGHSLEVPILLVDEKNKTIYANRNSSALNLTKENGFFKGLLPETISIKKGPVKIDKQNWALIPLPLPKNKIERQCIILHEAFHCLQPKLDLNPVPYKNQHMKEMEARVWLKLEWKALDLALNSAGKNRKQAITDAICFRKYRRAIFSNCKRCENRFEIHEGMAEYTANKICRHKESFKKYLHSKLECLWKSPSFVNCFAYYSGPVYAYLLDESGVNWRNHLSAKDDIASIVQSAYNITIPFDLFMEAEERSVLYSGAQILGEELDRKIEL